VKNNRFSFYDRLLVHDLSNILQNINSSAELSSSFLNNPEKIGKVKEYVDIIQKQVTRGSKLIKNIRQLSELDESHPPLQSVEACDILRKAIRFVETGFKDSDIKIEVDSQYKQFNVLANNFLQNVFENLLFNAINHNMNQTVEIIVRISREEKEENRFLKIEVIDNGIGVIDAQKKNIFLKQQNKNFKGKGLGFGLTLVQELVEYYKGQIWVEDKIKGDCSKGSNFIVLIPETD